MSSMLEQAIIDANALKEAAVKNAEAEILEKYSHEIKEAVESLLEQDEQEAVFDQDLEAEGGSEESDQVVQDLDLAVDASAADDEIVEIDLNFDLSDEPEASEVRSREEIALEVEDEQELRNLAENVEEEEEVSIDADTIKDLIEELVFDHELTPNGSTGSNTAKIEEDHEILRFKAEMAAKEEKEKELKENVEKLDADNSKLKRIILQLKEKLDEVSLSNAKLIYTNQTLAIASLNERQKNTIVESISDAGTIEEAKVIFKTLKSTVQSAPNRRRPKSLDEAVERKSSRLIYHNNMQEMKTFDPAVERMQRLAGIQKH